MAYFNDKYKKARLDQSPFLFHFIKGEDDNPHETLRKILNEQRLISSSKKICFSASPLTSITKFFETKVNRTGKPLYHPYGIAFSRDLLVRDFGARNVIYLNREERNWYDENIKSEFWNWRIETLEVDSYDFEYLREWRINGAEFDFSKFPQSDILVIAPDKNCLNDLIVRFDMKFTPIVDYINGDIEPDWEEEFSRNWKGIAVDKIRDAHFDDYAVLAATKVQKIGENMEGELFF